MAPSHDELAKSNSAIIDLNKVDSGEVYQVDKNHIVVNTSNSKNGGLTEIYRTLRLSSNHDTDARIHGGTLKLIDVNPSGDAIFSCETDKVYQLKGRAGEFISGDGIGIVGPFMVVYTDPKNKVVEIRYLVWSSSLRQ